MYKCAALSIKHFPGTHCADDIKRIVKDTVNEKLYLVLYDSGANIIRDIRVADLRSESCFYSFYI